MYIISICRRKFKGNYDKHITTVHNRDNYLQSNYTSDDTKMYACEYEQYQNH